jgi:hypothetical protein
MEYHEQAEVLQVAKPPQLVDAGVLAMALRIAANSVDISRPDAGVLVSGMRIAANAIELRPAGAVELPEAVKLWLVEVIARLDPELARVYMGELGVQP